VASLSKPAGGQSDALANAAITAVTKLADASGHPLKGNPGGSQASGSSNTGLVLGLVAAAALTGAALAAVMIRRRRPRPSQ
jgi:hypothetical protein